MSADPTTLDPLLHPYPASSESTLSTRGVPEFSLARVIEYIRSPTDSEEFFGRHGRWPCVIRSHPDSSIWSKEQLAELNKLFDEGRWKRDPGNPLLALVGNYRPSSPHMNELTSASDYTARYKKAEEDYQKDLDEFERHDEDKEGAAAPKWEDYAPRDDRTYMVSQLTSTY
jgi:hypothetical protein